MGKSDKWYQGKYNLQCSGSPVNGGYRVWGNGCLYENDKIYILTKNNSDRVEIIPETLSIKLTKKSEKFIMDKDGGHYLYEHIGPL